MPKPRSETFSIVLICYTSYIKNSKNKYLICITNKIIRVPKEGLIKSQWLWNLNCKVLAIAKNQFDQLFSECVQTPGSLCITCI